MPRQGRLGKAWRAPERHSARRSVPRRSRPNPAARRPRVILRCRRKRISRTPRHPHSGTCGGNSHRPKLPPARGRGSRCQFPLAVPCALHQEGTQKVQWTQREDPMSPNRDRGPATLDNPDLSRRRPPREAGADQSRPSPSSLPGRMISSKQSILERSTYGPSGEDRFCRLHMTFSGCQRGERKASRVHRSEPASAGGTWLLHGVADSMVAGHSDWEGQQWRGRSPRGI